MTASQFAQMLNARRIGRGKWQAKCPSHPDHKPSLSIAEGKRGVLVKCMSNGCETRDILAAVGLRWDDLFYDKATPAVRARTSLQDKRERLERELGLVVWLGALEKPKYWAAAEKRIRGELAAVRCQMEPLTVYRELRSEQWQRMNRTQREGVLERVWHSLNSIVQ